MLLHLGLSSLTGMKFQITTFSGSGVVYGWFSRYSLQSLPSVTCPLILLQEPILFRGTVFENVCKGLVGGQRKLSSEDKMKLVREACISSNSDGFIQELPNVSTFQLLTSRNFSNLGRVTTLKLANEQACCLAARDSV